MQITNVRIRPLTDFSRLKATANIVFDNELAINEIKIIQTDKRLCIEFPNHKKFGWELVAPLNKELRKDIETVILDAYEKQIST